MRLGTVSYRLDDLRKGVIIPIGMVGENDFTKVIFDAEDVYKYHPDAQVTMKVQPPKGGIYPATVTKDGNNVIWQVKAADLAHRGNGEIQLTFTADTMVEKSYIARTDIKRSLVGNGPAPDPVQDWVDNAEEVLEDLEAAEVHQPIIGLDGYWYTWNQGTGEYEKTNTKAQGQDGHSPVLTSSKSGKTTTIFADGDQLAQILDGEDGQGADVIDDTAGEGDTDKTWSADKLDTEITDVKSGLQGKPELKTTDAEDVDLDITDSDGDVLVRFKDGHIQTKKFNSKKIIAIKPTDAAGIDMDIADENGNVLLRMKDGEVITKNFDSGTDCKRVINPYKDVLFASDTEVTVTTHDHAKDQTAVDNLMSKNLDAIAISNYYPSQPYYPLSDYSLTVPSGTIEIPNAEHHSFTDDTSGAMHLNSIGSTFASGSPSGQTPLGIADTWRHGIIKMKRDLLIADGGGITVNHPVWSGVTTAKVIEMLDFDDTVLGIEIYNQDSELINGKGWAVDMWDDILKTGRRCWGFAVPDHRAEGSGSTNWEGKIVLLVPSATQENCLKAIRNGEFYIKIKHTSFALTDLEVEGNSVTVEVSESATIKTIIDGVVVDSSVGTTKSITIPSKAVYVRFEAETANDKLFTNPIIFKGRK